MLIVSNYNAYFIVISRGVQEHLAVRRIGWPLQGLRGCGHSRKRLSGRG